MSSQKEDPRSSALLRAYRSVFGAEGKRNEAQKLVMADMERRGYVWQNAWVPNKEGVIDPYRAAITEGQRIFAIETIQRANSRPGEEQKKPTVKKG